MTYKLQSLANSDAAILQGLIGLMLKVFSDRTAQEIINININFFMFNAYAYTRITNFLNLKSFIT